jgi:hypothetical protein
MVGFTEMRHADQSPVGTVAPAVIGAGEDGRRPFVVAAHFHAAVAAGIEEDVDPVGPVAAQDHRFLTHRRHEIVAGLGDLAFVPDMQPGAREDPLLLFGVDVLVDEDLAADLTDPQVNQAGAIAPRSVHRHGRHLK